MSWQDQLQPASWRGIGFFVDDHSVKVGRRKVINEFPGADAGFTEDLGRNQRRFSLKAYVIGDDYMAARDQLVAAVERDGSAGTLVHPWLGRLSVQCISLDVAEKKDDGGMATLSFTFVEEGQAAAPAATADTAGNVLGLTPATFNLLRTAFTLAFSVNNLGSLVAGFGVSMLGDLAGRILGLAGVPSSYLGGVSAAVFAIFANPGPAAADPGAAAANICAGLSAYAGAVVQYQTDLAAGDAPPSYPSSAASIQNDPTGGLEAFGAQFAQDYSVLPAPTTPDRIEQGVNQLALVDLANAAVAIAVAEIFAQCDFDSANAANAARDQLIGLFDTPLERAADTDQDDLYGGLVELRAAAMADIATRGAALLPLLNWTVPRPRTAIALAMLFYPDFAGRDAGSVDASIESAASDLIVRNAMVHPAFAPTSGQALAG